jgi:hypothetical protein
MKHTACAKCVFWEQLEEQQADLGKCRRHAPRSILVADIALWPTTKSEDWCGEGQEKPRKF